MRTALVLPLLLVLTTATACGATAVEVARETITTATHATVKADQVFASAYEVYSDNARASSATQAEKDQKMEAWDRAADEMERAQTAARASLVAAETVLDGFERTGDASYWDEALACIAATLRDVAKVLDERGLKIPAALAKVLTLSEGLTCAGNLK